MLLGNFYDVDLEAGCDEAGRGCLAGRVYAAAVIFPRGYTNADLADSKTLSAAKRYRLRETIKREALAWAVGYASPQEIDEINILRASILSMHRALSALSPAPEAVIVDGNRFTPWDGKPYTTIVKGDGMRLSIAAASILAKTFRDDYMEEIAREYPVYCWSRNKGYPTREHRRAIAEYGPSPYHRRSFTLLPQDGPSLFKESDFQTKQ